MDKRNEYEYVAVEECIDDEETGGYISFGISAYYRGEQVAHVSDVSTDNEAVCRLVERCNEAALSPMHLEDVVEDFLAEV